MRRARIAVPAALAAAALAAVPGAASAAATFSLDGWGTIAADMADGRLVWADQAAARTRTFTYWRTDAGRMRVGPRGFIGRPESLIAVRTSAGPMSSSAVRAGTGGRFVLLAGGRGFAPPVIWCCDDDGVEVVMESDGRSEAPRAVAAGLDGDDVRMLLGRSGLFALMSARPSDPGARRGAPLAGRPGVGLASITPGVAAWADAPAYGRPAVRWGIPTDLGVTGVRSLPQPGAVLGVWAARRLLVVAVRRSGRVEIARYDLPGSRRRVLWSGAAMPPLAAGGGAVAVADGRRLLTARSGRLVPAGTAGGDVAALATDGRRVAVFERRTRGRAAARVKVTVARLVAVR